MYLYHDIIFQPHSLSHDSQLLLWLQHASQLCTMLQKVLQRLAAGDDARWDCMVSRASRY